MGTTQRRTLRGIAMGITRVTKEVRYYVEVNLEYPKGSFRRLDNGVWHQFVDGDYNFCDHFVSSILDGEFAKYMAVNSKPDVTEEISKLKNELEVEQMRLIACGIAAMQNTLGSSAENRNINQEYRSGSYDEVVKRVDECIRLRSERDDLAMMIRRLARALGGNRLHVSQFDKLESDAMGLLKRLDLTGSILRGREEC